MVTDLALDKQGRVWVATAQGLSVFNGNVWASYSPVNSGIPGEMVSKVAVTPDGRVWLHSRSINGSLGMGLTVFDGASWFTYTTANSGLADDDIRSLAVDLNGHLWIGTWDGDVNRFDGASWTTFPNINFNGLAIQSLAVDSLNRKWFVSLPSTVWMNRSPSTAPAIYGQAARPGLTAPSGRPSP
jgi:ligand-binding sensor domain-containing protein